jgi:hypothetical protein
MIVIALVCYVGARAYSISITIDEALTFAWHVPGTLRDILLLRTPGLEDNNHVLLTLLSKASVGVFGASEAAIRLPSVVGYVIFLAAIFHILRYLASGWVHPLGMLAIGGNPYLVDYFTVARGYGLALSLSAAGLALLLDGTRDRHSIRQRSVYLAFLLFTMAAVAQLTFALLMVAAIVVFWAPYVVGGRARELLRMLRPRTAAAWLTLAMIAQLQIYVIHLTLVLKRVGLLSAGNARDFWSGTVGSLVDGTLYGNVSVFGRYIVFAWIVATVAAATLSAGATIVRNREAPGTTDRSALATVVGLMLLVGLGSVLQHLIFGVALLDGRRAIALLPLFLLCALALPKEGFESGGRIKAFIGIALGVAGPALLALHGLLVANVSRIRDWPHDSATREVMRQIAQRAAGNRQPMRLLVFWPLAPAAEFYRQKLGMNEVLEPISMSERPGYLGNADFYYVLDSQKPDVIGRGGTPVAAYPGAGTTLLARLGE